MRLNETKCTITLQGREFTNQGAYVDGPFAMVYVKIQNNSPNVGSTISVTDWHGNVLGHGHIVSMWTMYGSIFGQYRMVSVRFVIDGVYYSGRFNYDNGELVRAKKVEV